VPLELGDPEVQSLEIEEDGAIDAEVRLCLLCAECGEEMKESVFEFEDRPAEIARHVLEHNEANTDYELSIEEDETEASDRFQTKDRHGRTIKNFRYRRHFYSVELRATAHCSCGASFEVSFSDEVQASGMEDLT
jgi:hypothetical protein